MSKKATRYTLDDKENIVLAVLEQYKSMNRVATDYDIDQHTIKDWSDRGSQYTSKGYRFITTEAGMTRSMSRVGKCTDNAPIESFFGHFKCEQYDLKQYQTYDVLVSDFDPYMYFYNHNRFPSKLNSLTPVEYRHQAAA